MAAGVEEEAQPGLMGSVNSVAMVVVVAEVGLAR